MNRIVPDYVVGFVYGALVESFSCEQNARMMAMEAATNSAKDMLHELDIMYNRARQAAITQEITEVIAGAKSQKRACTVSTYNSYAFSTVYLKVHTVKC